MNAEMASDEAKPRNSLAQILRTGTQRWHIEAERAGVMPRLLRGQLPLALYCKLLHNLLAIYSALEPALQGQRAHPCIAPLWNPALARKKSIERDLAELDSHARAAALPLQVATQRYVEDVERAALNAPERLVAHAYVRYLGDLSGGQILKRIVSSAYALDDGRGTHFYDFGVNEQVAKFSRALREGLEQIPADASLIGAILAEARSAFELHRELFVQLESNSTHEAK